MKVELKTWTGLGLATALVGAGLAGCAGEAGENGEAGEGAETSAVGEMGEGEAGEGESGTGEGGEGEAGEGEGGEGEAGEGGEGEGGEVGTLPLQNRLVFMAGHVEAGLALYRAGEAEMAAPHLLHPVSETHASEREGLENLGFDPAPFEAVSTALDAGQPASDIEPQLAAAEANLVAVREAGGGDPIGQIRFLMDIAVEEYAIAVNDGVVTDPGEYQDAWGFVVVARQIADGMSGDRAPAIRNSLDALLAMWPETAPIPPADPAPVGQVSALASRVLLDLPQS